MWHAMISILFGVVSIGWGIRTCYFGFRKGTAPEIMLTDDPKLGKSAHRLFGIGMIVCGILAIGSGLYDMYYH
jgi:hypothetical protein